MKTKYKILTTKEKMQIGDVYVRLAPDGSMREHSTVGGFAGQTKSSISCLDDDLVIVYRKIVPKPVAPKIETKEYLCIKTHIGIHDYKQGNIYSFTVDYCGITKINPGNWAPSVFNQYFIKKEN